MSRLMMLAALGLVAACSSATNSSAATDAQVIAALDARRNELERVAVSRDAERFVAFYAPDARLREPGTVLDGPQVAAYIRDFFSKGQVTALDIRPAKVYVHGNFAYEFGEYDESASLGGQTISLKNNYALRWRKVANGSWVIDHLVAGPRGN